MSVSSFMGYLKGKSSLMLYEQFGDLNIFKYEEQGVLVQEGTMSTTVGKNDGEDYRIALKAPA